MRRITIMLMSTLAGVILLFSYRTSTHATSSSAAGGASTAPGVVSGGAAQAASVVNGSVAQTRWGPVQVRVTIASGKITDVQAIQQPSDNPRDEEINSYALPQLRDQVLQTQSARIDGVSGATVTSDGYVESLQAALDSANFG